MSKQQYSPQDPIHGKTFDKTKEIPPLPPAYDSFPTSMRIRTDPITNAVIPTPEAVQDVKRWVDYNTK